MSNLLRGPDLIRGGGVAAKSGVQRIRYVSQRALRAKPRGPTECASAMMDGQQASLSSDS